MKGECQGEGNEPRSCSDVCNNLDLIFRYAWMKEVPMAQLDEKTVLLVQSLQQ